MTCPWHTRLFAGDDPLPDADRDDGLGGCRGALVGILCVLAGNALIFGAWALWRWWTP